MNSMASDTSLTNGLGQATVKSKEAGRVQGVQLE